MIIGGMKMSFVMTHLAIAKGINDKISIARNLHSFYLGQYLLTAFMLGKIIIVT
jgi:hypothetical protein